MATNTKYFPGWPMCPTRRLQPLEPPKRATCSSSPPILICLYLAHDSVYYLYWPHMYATSLLITCKTERPLCTLWSAKKPHTSKRHFLFQILPFPGWLPTKYTGSSGSEASSGFSLSVSVSLSEQTFSPHARTHCTSNRIIVSPSYLSRGCFPTQ